MKKFLYILLIVIACTLLTLGMLFSLTQSSKVQTAAVNVVAQELTKALGTNISIRKTDYSFPNRLTITGIYIEDQQGDTLLFADTLKADFSLTGLFNNKIFIREAQLKHAYANAYSTDDGMNYDFLLALIPKQQEDKPMQQTIEVKNVQLNDLRLRYNDLNISDLNANLDLHHFDRDSLFAEISHLSFTEKQGFVLTDLQAAAQLTHEKAEISKLRVQLPSSTLDMQGSIRHNAHNHSEDSESMFKHLFDLSNIESADVDMHINQADIVLSDIGSIVPQVKNMKGNIGVTGNVSGIMRDIKATDLSLAYKGKNILSGDVNFYGLPRLDTSYVHADLQDLAVNRAVIQDFISDLKGKPFLLPKNLAQLGEMHYRGILDGRLDSMTLNGVFTSRLGNISTNGQLTALADDYSLMNFRGMVQTKRFALGRLLGQKQIGNIAFKVQADATNGEQRSTTARVKGDVSYIQLNDYTYNNIHIDGNYNKDEFKGKVKINDENLILTVDGLLDLTQDLPVVNAVASLDRLRLGPLNLSDKYADADFSAQVVVNGAGNSLDNINGYLYIDSLLMKRDSKQLFMNQLRVLAQTDDDKPTNLKINSDFLNANISGEYLYSTLPLTFRRVISQYVPRAIGEQKRTQANADTRLNKLEYYFYFKQLDKITDVLDLNLSIPKMPTIKGFIDETTNKHALQVAVPQLVAGSQTIDDITLNLDNRSQQLNLALSLYKHASDNPAGEKMGDLQALLKAVGRNDSLYLDLSFQNTDSSRTEGNLYTATHFSQYAGRPLIDCHILPSEITIADSVWTMSDSHVVYSAHDTTLQVNHLRFGGESQFIFADGLASKRENDSINIQLSNIVLDYLLEYTNAKNAISFGGAATGWATAYGLFSKPMFDAEVWMDDAKINGELMGDAHATATLNREQKTIDIWGAVTEQTDTVARLDGIVKIADGRWDLFIYPDSANIAFVNYWTDGFLDNITGRGYGWVHVFGIPKHTWVEGKAFAKDATIGIPFLGTVYHLNDTVSLGLDNITFENITLYDDEHHPLKLNGIVKHDNFRDFIYEIDASCENTLVMDLPENTHDMFYGHIYATGNVSIRGNEKECRIAANARTDRNSSFSFSVATASTAHDNSFITFVDHNQVVLDSKSNGKNGNNGKTQEPESSTRVYVDVQVEATPDLDVSIVIDPASGDQLKGRGEGNIHFQYDVTTDDVSLYGTYTLQSGTFQFTLQNLIRKEFTIRNGSTVTFSGNPMQPVIDASASYSTTASLRDLFGSEYTTVATNRSSVPVNCIIYLRENLMNPVISFGIELPQSDESVASQVKSVINTDEMLMREIIYLLVFNRFYTPEYLQTNTAVGVTETYSLLTSTVTSQINNWIKKLTNNFTVGFNIRADGFDSESSQEYETQFQYTPNNRLIINGNFGYRHNDISNQPIFGNLDVEYLLTSSGMLRAKAYTHTVDKYSLREAHTVQGVGLTFKYDFNGIDDKPRKSNSHLKTKKKKK